MSGRSGLEQPSTKGMNVQVVDYTGDGTNNRVIALTFTPTMVNVFVRSSRDTTFGDFAFILSAGDLAWWTLQTAGSIGIQQSSVDPNPIVANGFNVGFIGPTRFWNSYNTTSTLYRIFAFG